MTKDSKQVLYEQIVQARQIFVYFLITMNIGMVGFIANQIMKQNYNDSSGIIQALLIIVLIGHAISIGLGLYYQNRAQRAMSINLILLKEKDNDPTIIPSKDPRAISITNELESLYYWVIGTLSISIILFAIIFMIIVSIVK